MQPPRDNLGTEVAGAVAREVRDTVQGGAVRREVRGTDPAGAAVQGVQGSGAQERDPGGVPAGSEVPAVQDPLPG